MQKTRRYFRLVIYLASVSAAVLGFACGDRGNGASSASRGAGSALLPSVSASAAPGKPPLTTQGSSVAYTPDEDQAVVADEDHEALFVVGSDFSPSSLHVVSMPGPPSQVVALDGLVFVTVRTLPTDAARALHDTMRGPAPTSGSAQALPESKVSPGIAPRTWAPAPSASASESAGPPASKPSASASASTSASASASAPAKAGAPPIKRGTPPLSLDPGVLRQSQGGLLMALRPDASAGLVEVGRVVLAPDAWGLALTPDHKRAVVTSAWAAEVSVIDVSDPAQMKIVSHEKVAREPRGVAISGDGKTAFVSHVVGSDLTRIDDLDATPKVSVLPLPAALSRALHPGETTASLGYALALSPDGKTLYAPRHALGADGAGSWWGEPTVDALDIPTGKPLQPEHVPGSPRDAAESFNVENVPWFAQPGQAPSVSVALLQPRAVLYRRSTDTLLVASEGSDRVAELGTRVPDPATDVERTFVLGAGYDTWGDYVRVGGAPSGLALSRDENTLLVWCRSTFDVARIHLSSGKVEWMHLADDGLPLDAVHGRRLFFNALSTTISGGLACASCHPDGRDDGYVWREAEALDGNRFVARADLLKIDDSGNAAFKKPPLYPRQTPILAGRVRADGPYGWHGQDKDLHDRLVDGFHLHRPTWRAGTATKTNGPDVARIDYLADFIRSGLFPPPTLVHELTAAEQRGKKIYESDAAKCMTCHLGDGGSDRKVVQLEPLPNSSDFDSEPDHGFKVPSLTFVSGSAPYFHDGSASTLEDLVRKNGQRMGDTSHLNADDKDALVAYLRTL